MAKFSLRFKNLSLNSLNILSQDPWGKLAENSGKLVNIDSLARPWSMFSREAQRWFRIAKRLRLPGAPKSATQKHLRLTFNNKRKSLLLKLVYLYGEEAGRTAFERIEKKLVNSRRARPRGLVQRDAYFDPVNRFTQKDVILIVYPDSLREPGRAPLQSLRSFAEQHLLGAISTIHILPFYPYSSDRGFSVINYKKVDPRFGNWEDIALLSRNFGLMFDGVFNHLSSKSMWFRKFLSGNELYKNHFIAYDSPDAISKEQLKRIVRPRTSPLLTPFKTKLGVRHVWTTFSPDQVDLNFRESRVLLRLIDVIIRYAHHGATLIRLDAVNYVWKQPGTSCVNLRQTHVIVQLLRDVLDIAAPSVSLVTETNIPHAQNISYFGNGRNEAQMVYNFALPPLVLHAFYKGTARYISRWADRLEGVSRYCTYFNFLASHDGIGLRPARRVLPYREVQSLIKTARKRGSLVQNRSLGSGKSTPYELNITWWSAINDEKADEPEEIRISRYLASRALALSLKGVPGIYFHSLFGTRNDSETVSKTKVTRDINRRNLELRQVEEEIAGEQGGLFRRLMDMIRARAREPAFHPNAGQQVLLENDQVFSMLRTSVDKTEKILVLINVTAAQQQYNVSCKALGLSNRLYDLISRRHILVRQRGITISEFQVSLEPYQVMWIRSKGL